MSTKPKQPSGFEIDKPKPVPTDDSESVTTIVDGGMGAQDRANTNSIIQTSVLMNLARLLNSQKYLGSGIPFSPNSNLTITVWNSITNQSVAFQLWYIDTEGKLLPLPSSGIPPNALTTMTSITNDRQANYEVVNMPSTGGIIVSFEARIAQSRTTRRGQTLVKAEIDNAGTFIGTNFTIPSTQVIAYGYCYTKKDLTYPSTDAIQDPVSGDGVLLNYNISNTSTTGGAGTPVAVQKFYLHDATTLDTGTLPGGSSQSATSPTATGTGATVNRSMDANIGKLQVTGTVSGASGTNNWFRRFVSAPLSAQTIAAGAWQIRAALRNDPTANRTTFKISAIIYVWRPSTGTKVGNIIDGVTTGIGNVSTSSITDTSLATITASGTPQTTVAGDILVIEVWGSYSSGTVSNAWSFFYDGTVEGSITSNAAYLLAPTGINLISGGGSTGTITYTVPANTRQKIKAVIWTLSLSSSAGTRSVILIFTDENQNETYETTEKQFSTISTSFRTIAIANYPITSDAGFTSNMSSSMFMAPDTILLAGAQAIVQCTNFQTNDVLTFTTIYVEEFIEPAN